MKLGTLLAAGKSLMRGHAEVCYRANKQAYLPKFGSVKNPFKPETAQSAAHPGNSAPAAMPAVARATHAAPEIAAATTPAPRFPGPAQQLSASPAAEKKAQWADKFNPARIFQRAATGSAGKPSEPAAKTQKPAVTQTELSLDSVKVLHNDLSDVDVEVVPMKSRSGAAESQTPKKSWEFLGERLLGIEAS